VLTQPKALDDQREMNKCNEHDVEFLESGEYPTEGFEASEQPLDLVTAPVHGPIVFPGGNSVRFGWNNRGEPKIQGKLARFIALVSTIHDEVHRPRRRPQCFEKLASFGRIMGLTGRERERYGRSIIRGNHMNLGGPSSTGLADGLRAVFFSAPVPSGWTLTAVLSRDTASIFTRTS